MLNILLNRTVRIILVLLVCLVPLLANGEGEQPSIYTIQIATHGDLETSQKHFKDIADKLDPPARANLRIEQVGKYFPLRLGVFKGMTEARAFLQSVKSAIPSAIIQKTVFLDERIVQIYKLQPAEEEKPLQAPSPNAEDRKPRQEASTEVTTDKAPEIEKAPVVTKSDTGGRDIPDEGIKSRKPPQEASSEVTADKEPEVEETPVVTKSNSVGKDIPEEEKISSIASLVYNKNYESALEIIKNEIKAQPQHPELNAMYGTVLLKTAKPEEAHQYLEKAVELSPSTPDYHNGLGYCYFYLDDYEKAIESFKKSLSLEAGHVDSLAGLGIIYARKGDKKTSLVYYSRLKELDPDSAGKLLKIIEHAK